MFKACWDWVSRSPLSAPSKQVAVTPGPDSEAKGVQLFVGEYGAAVSPLTSKARKRAKQMLEDGQDIAAAELRTLCDVADAAFKLTCLKVGGKGSSWESNKVFCDRPAGGLHPHTQKETREAISLRVCVLLRFLI